MGDTSVAEGFIPRLQMCRPFRTNYKFERALTDNPDSWHPRSVDIIQFRPIGPLIVGARARVFQ